MFAYDGSAKDQMELIKNVYKGNEYFSIVYEDNAGKQKSFSPDYIVHDTEGNTWIIETNTIMFVMKLIQKQWNL